MNHHRSIRLVVPLCAGLLTALLTGCGQKQPVASASARQAPAVTGRPDVGQAIQLLGDGKDGQARAMLVEVLARQPADPVAADLLRQIDSDPVTLLGKPSFGYTARAGDTLPTLAEQFLGKATRFYALGRYNGLSFPATLKPGQALRIPGVIKAPAQRAAAATVKSTPVTVAAKPVAPAVAPRSDPERTAKLRGAALEQLNRGAIDRAIALLRQADQASPGNPLVQRDLDRALRIQHAVQSRS